MTAPTMPPFRPHEPLARGISLLEASAGTGKTYNITNLVLRLIAEQHLSITEIVVVTFTRAATSELRDRVRARLGQAFTALEQTLLAGAPPPELDDPVLCKLATDAVQAGAEEIAARLERVSRARECFDEALIATIHGFCQQTLQLSAFESDLDFEAELVEDIGPVLEELVDDFIALELRNVEPDWYRYVTRMAKVTRSDLLRLAQSLEAEPELRILPAWPGPLARHHVWNAAIGELSEIWNAGGREQAPQLLIDAFADGCFRSGRIYNSKRPQRQAAELDRWLRSKALSVASPYEPRETIRYFSSSQIQGQCAAGRRAPSHPVFDAAARLLVRPAEALKLRFVSWALEQIPARKHARNVLSFSDQLRRLDRGLRRPETRAAIRESLRARFQAALIDEFQDTDPVQWRIFHAAFGDDAFLYLIGDPKQAIYAFRGADVYTYVAAKDEARAGQHTLPTNWRSDGRYVDALNHLLDQRGVFAERGIEYVVVNTPPEHRDDRLVFPDGPRAPLQLTFFGRTLAGGSPPGAAESAASTEMIGETWLWQLERFPEYVATDIARFLGSGATLAVSTQAAARAVEPGDIAVLVRTNSQARAVHQALLDAGVPAVVSSAGSVYRSAEAEALQRLLEALLRPSSERAAKAALASLLFGATAIELAEMAEPDWEQWLVEAHRWNALWREQGFSSALRRVFADRDVPGRLLARPDGERAMTNVLHLAELLHAAEQTERLGPTALAAWLRNKRFEDERETDDTVLRLESDADAVTIVTIHRSKGLEYPVVWCPYLWQGWLLSRSDKRHLRFHDPDAELTLSLDLRLDHDTGPKAQNLARCYRERQTENLRLLYVALTRARHRCVVYWGPFEQAETSPLAPVLHSGLPRSAAGDRLQAAQTRLPTLTDPELLADLQELEARSGGTIDVVAAEPLERVSWSQPAPSARRAKARSFTRQRLDRWWRRGSYSAMARGAAPAPSEGSPEAEGRDLDAAAERVAEAPPTEHPSIGSAADVPLGKFPRGADPGTFLHHVLETFDFRRLDEPGSLEHEITVHMAHHGIAGEWRAVLVEGLTQALRTPLGSCVGDARLGDIARRDRLDELRFEFPVAGGYEDPVRPNVPSPASGTPLSAALLGKVFLRLRSPSVNLTARHLERLASLQFAPPLRGFLTGAIDLVFRHTVGDHAQWFIVDYKSNWLGTADGEHSFVHHYHPDALAEAMSHHHYHLQYHLYTVALHRYLRWRLGDGYDYDRDFGGVLYLFLRGMIGEKTPRDSTGQPCGVFFDRPPLALIQGLSQLLHDPGQPDGERSVP